MTSVGIARAHALAPQNYWDATVGDLIVDAGAPLVRDFSIDAIFAARVEGQSDAASLAADRLGLRPSIALTLDAADASGAVALRAAYMAVSAGQSRTALVVGATKVSDLSEPERLAFMDLSLDREASGEIDFATQVGLLGGYALTRRGLDATTFLEITTENHAAWARHNARPVQTLAEFKHDLVAAPPLMRSDFALLQDGACAVVLTSEKSEAPLAIKAMAQATDIVSPWERNDPLEFAAVARALGMLPRDAMSAGHVEVDCAASPIEYLVRDAVARFCGTGEGAGAAVRGHNRNGGSQGRGRVFGASALYQLSDLLDVGPQHPTDNLLLAVAGMGNHIVCAHLAREGSS
jgi:acetyl-CoA C-acetyltransferase